MQRLITWIKNNKLAAILLLVVVYFLWPKGPIINPLSYKTASLPTFNTSMGVSESMMTKGIGGGGSYPVPINDVAPVTNVDRLIVQESNLSLVVKQVAKTVDEITSYAKANGGFMVSSSLSNPEEAAFANVVIRVPEGNLKNTLEYLRSLAVKVASENLSGSDVTDQYVDIESRLATLNKTKAKFEEIMTRATEVQDILTVQRELISLQDQIDNLKGRQQYLEKTAALSKITVYLSTDELALPYAPDQPFRPSVIFKTAVRSLLLNLQNIAGSIIWIIVFSVIWVPLGVVGLIAYKLYTRRQKQQA